MKKKVTKGKKKKVALLLLFSVIKLLTKGKKRRLSHDNPTFSFNLKSNTMKNTMQKYCFLVD